MQQEAYKNKGQPVGYPFSEQVGASVRIGQQPCCEILEPLRGAGIRAGYPNSYPLSEASLCPYLSLHSLPGCIQCVVLFPVILDVDTIPIEF